MNRALFLDRDGIFNKIVFRDGQMHSPRNWSEVEHEKGLTVLAHIKKRGFKLIMVTNQPDLERGLVSQSFLDELHSFYKDTYALDGIYVCPFSSNDHPDKKPNPGMLLQATKEFNLDLKASFFIGDTERDMVAATRCDCTFILFDRNYNKELKANKRIYTLKTLLDYII